jgi:hypothetical protein
MDFEIAVVGVGLAREQALDLAATRFVAQRVKQRLGVGNHRCVALGLS